MVNTIDSLSPARWVPSPPRGGSSNWAALRGWLARHWPKRRRATPDDAFAELVDLDAHTLADIGAPEPLLGRAMARREMWRQERATLHIGLASGGWRHW